MVELFEMTVAIAYAVLVQHFESFEFDSAFQRRQADKDYTNDLIKTVTYWSIVWRLSLLILGLSQACNDSRYHTTRQCHHLRWRIEQNRRFDRVRCWKDGIKLKFQPSQKHPRDFDSPEVSPGFLLNVETESIMINFKFKAWGVDLPARLGLSPPLAEPPLSHSTKGRKFELDLILSTNVSFTQTQPRNHIMRSNTSSKMWNMGRWKCGTFKAFIIQAFPSHGAYPGTII